MTFELNPEHFEDYYRNGVRHYGLFKIYAICVSLFVVWLEIKLGRRWVNSYVFGYFCSVHAAWADDVVHAAGSV